MDADRSVIRSQAHALGHCLERNVLQIDQSENLGVFALETAEFALQAFERRLGLVGLRFGRLARFRGEGDGHPPPDSGAAIAIDDYAP